MTTDNADLDSAAVETTSSKIRALSASGMGPSEVAKELGIRYQHAYNVMKRGAPSTVSEGERPIVAEKVGKPPLPVSVLADGGFDLLGQWTLSATGELVVDQPLPKEVGVYAFAKDGFAVYVGVATMGISKRLYFYSRPGITQRTSQRLNAKIKSELANADTIQVYTAIPPDLEWNGLPVHGSAGLELGLIKKYALPWNMRSAG
ncbi:GIY-YIG nuclease family protein [Rhizobium leguminosarum]|uniref:GIY-YIG nuclease family protein n=1 Tax=Rhizobium leguminosarum TaxID=384 RepID=UPI001C98BCFF|nr:GIY-YIG nuclease family protein [Rhizobium leguminosarum]MBY5551110.1 GIY-YIG nuclease family protein [Rhizobium leguminosarum]